MPDLVTISRAADGYSPGQLAVLIGNGDGTYTEPHPRKTTGVDPEGLAILDLDRSGGIDVAVANRFNNDVMAFRGDGTGDLVGETERYGSGYGPFALVPAVFNEDFRMDVAAVIFSGNTVSVLLNNYPVVDQLASVDVVAGSTITWAPVAGATSYRVYRGRLALLDADNYGQCLNPTVTATQYTDSDPIAVGDGFFYLVTAVANGAEGPLGYSSTCVSRPNFNPCFVP